MRRLVLLSLVALVAIPLSAHGRWHRPRRVVVVEPRPVYRTWDDDRWACRDRGWYRDDFDAPRVIYRPLPPRPPLPPFQGRVELWFR